MLKSSLRHVARTSPTHPAPARPPLSSPRAASFSSRSHQRRHSSSKPPIPPNNGTRNIQASSVKTVGTPRSKEASSEQSPTAKHAAAADVRIPKRKVARQKTNNGQDGGSQWTKNMPSVPSTQHLSLDGMSPMASSIMIRLLNSETTDVAISSFFSLHRPMSVTTSIPHEAPLQAIDAIFAPKKQSSRQSPGPQDVIYTIASAVQSLEATLTQQQQNSQPLKSEPRRTDITTALAQHQNNQTDPNQTQHLDGQPPQINIRTPKGVQLMIQEVARHFRPYNTPPAPVPMSDADLDAREAEVAAAEAAEEGQAKELERQIESQDGEYAPNQRRVVVTLHDNADLQSRKFFTHKAPLVPIKDPRTHRDIGHNIGLPDAEAPSPIGRVRRGRYPAQKEREIKIHRPSFYAISVKRQRRLKMKKHKYKKLMRK